MNTSAEPVNTTPPRRSIFSRTTLVAFFAGAALVGGIAAATAAGIGACGFHHGTSGLHSGADVSEHVDHMLKHMYVEIDASEAQKAQITPLVKQAVNDLLPMHAQLQAAHEQALRALTGETVDRTALEAARVAHLQLADQASKRLTQLLADVDEVLTPAQRTAVAARLKNMHVRS
ncbi:MAG TPA: periplasmic heavy metal sensor [Steroidobacteraceae bacterium]|jgi:Spy/CpxP family protein refolding chaperone